MHLPETKQTTELPSNVTAQEDNGPQDLSACLVDTATQKVVMATETDTGQPLSQPCHFVKKQQKAELPICLSVAFRGRGDKETESVPKGHGEKFWFMTPHLVSLIFSTHALANMNSVTA